MKIKIKTIPALPKTEKIYRTFHHKLYQFNLYIFDLNSLLISFEQECKTQSLKISLGVIDYFVYFFIVFFICKYITLLCHFYILNLFNFFCSGWGYYKILLLVFYLHFYMLIFATVVVNS